MDPRYSWIAALHLGKQTLLCGQQTPRAIDINTAPLQNQTNSFAIRTSHSWMMHRNAQDFGRIRRHKRVTMIIIILRPGVKQPT